MISRERIDWPDDHGHVDSLEGAGATVIRGEASFVSAGRLAVKGDKPCYQGPLQLLTRARRLEAAWWDAQADAPALRDYFIARSESVGLLWVFRERLSADVVALIGSIDIVLGEGDR